MSNKKGTSGDAPIVQEEHITEHEKSKCLFLEILEEGNKKTKTELAERMHISPREIRGIASELRKEGYNICSSSREPGYWLGNKEEMRELIGRYLSQANEMERVAQAMSEKLGEWW